jgi:hypothetical protein
MHSNNPPINDVPLELSDQEVDILMERLRHITDTLEQHYYAQLHRLEQEHETRCASHPGSDSVFDGPESDPPF